MYLVAILCPPLAVLFCGKPFQAILNLVLTLLFYVPGLIHALIVVSEVKSNERSKKLAQDIASANKPTGNLKKCPFCAEEIQADALICKHCKKEINVIPVESKKPVEDKKRVN